MTIQVYFFYLLVPSPTETTPINYTIDPPFRLKLLFYFLRPTNLITDPKPL
ncbi:hypothetical protein D3C87_735010 [compost metagenome]